MARAARPDECALQERRERREEWERQLERLDEEGIQVHQSQLRIVRDHLLRLGDDVVSLREEVAALSASLREPGQLRAEDLEALHAHVETSVHGGLQRALQEARTAQQRLEAAHRHTQSQHADLAGELESLKRRLLEERQAREDLHGDVQESVKRHFAYEKLERDLRNSSSSERLDRLESLIGVEASQLAAADIEERPAPHERGPRRRRPAAEQQGAAAAVRRGPMLAEPGQGRHDCGGQSGRDLEAVQLSLGQLQERLAACEQASGTADARFAWAKDRIEGLEASCRAAGEELRIVATGQARQDVELESHCAWVAGGLSGLERRLAEAASSLSGELDMAFQRLERLQSCVLSLQTEIPGSAASHMHARLCSLEQTFQGYLEGVMGGVPGRGRGGAAAAPAAGPPAAGQLRREHRCQATPPRAERRPAARELAAWRETPPPHEDDGAPCHAGAGGS